MCSIRRRTCISPCTTFEVEVHGYLPLGTSRWFGWVQWFLPLRAHLTIASVPSATGEPNNNLPIPHQDVRRPRYVRRCNPYLAYGDQRYRYAYHTTQSRPHSPRIGDCSAAPPSSQHNAFHAAPKTRLCSPLPIVCPCSSLWMATAVLIGYRTTLSTPRSAGYGLCRMHLPASRHDTSSTAPKGSIETSCYRYEQ